MLIGEFNVVPVKVGKNQPCYEISYGIRYLAMIMQSPKTGKWAVTHNMWLDPNSSDAAERYRYSTPDIALQAYECGMFLRDRITFDATCLNILPKTPDTIKAETAQKVVDRAKLEAIVNDPRKSEGARMAARKLLSAVI